MDELKFPKNFLWGAATSAHQVEGNCDKCDWWQAETDGLVPYQSGIADDHYNRFAADFELAKQLGHNAHRFSIEWSRIEPRPGIFDEAATVHYRRVLLNLRERGLEPIVTLHHFTNPKWFAEIGGWTSPQSSSYFGRFVKYCLEHFGDYVNYWVTINEPNAYVTLGLLAGRHPPFKKNPYLALKVFLNLRQAHVDAYDLIHKNNNAAIVGPAINFVAFGPSHKFNPVEKFLAAVFDFLYNRYFLKLIKGKYDYIGLNYYFYHRINSLAPYNKTGGLTGNDAPPDADFSDIHWEINPDGLLQTLREISRYRKPIIITENGLADRADKLRGDFILSHLLMLYSAIAEGIDIKGYLHWSLLDNFEWAQGFTPRFGLIEVDYENQQRKIRPSAIKYATYARHNAVSVSDARTEIEKSPKIYPPVLHQHLQKITRLTPL